MRSRNVAISLELPTSIADAPSLIPRFFFFIITFALVAMFWALHYRMYRWTFAAEQLDVILNMALLADIALLPFALQLFFRFKGASLAFLAYAGVLGIAFALLGALAYRGFRKYQAHIPVDLQLGLWRAVMRHAVSGALLLASIPLIMIFGKVANLTWLLILVGAVVLRRTVKNVPRFASAAAPSPQPLSP